MGTSLTDFKKTLVALDQKKELPLPSSVSFEAFRNAAIIAVQDNPGILQCSPDSVFRAVRQLAAVGLVPDGREAAIVPFKGKATATPMVYGLIKAARNSGQVVSMWAEVVYEGETLQLWIEDGERRFDHRYEDGSILNPMRREVGQITGAYAVAKLKDGTVEFQPMSREEIEKRRKASPNQKSDTPTGIWADWYEEMAKKTVIRALCKRLPMSSEDYTRIEADPTFREVPIKDVTPETTEQRLKRIRQEREQEAVTGEVVEEPVYDEMQVFPGDEAFDEGVKAFQAGVSIDDNPYGGNPGWSNWRGGHLQAASFAEEGAA